MTYRLQFLPAAKAEWDKLDGSVQLQFTKVLTRRLEAPRLPSAALAAMPDCYKIKLRNLGFRLVYRVCDDKLLLLTIAVGKRDKNAVYEVASGRLKALVTVNVKTSSDRKNPSQSKPAKR
jgi:mRNA interferase RelE/StbE